MAKIIDRKMSSKKKLSIVATLYKSDSVIEEFVSKVITAAGKLGLSYEIVLVNDGSPDTSLEKALKLQLQEPSIVIVDLARNFGHHPAILAGLSEAKGDFIFLIDSDLEEDPAWISQFIEKMREMKADVVFGQQKRRKGGIFESATGNIFYWIFNFLCETKIPANFVTARLMTRQYVDALLEYGERTLFLGGTFVLTGFKQVSFPINKKTRALSTYSLYMRLKLFVDALTSFSPRPLYLVFAFGLIIIFLSLIGLIYICLQAMSGKTLIGWASVIVSVWLLGGLTLFSIGLVGTYVGKTLLETKRRPLFKVRCVYRRSRLLN